MKLLTIFLLGAGTVWCGDGNIIVGNGNRIDGSKNIQLGSDSNLKGNQNWIVGDKKKINGNGLKMFEIPRDQQPSQTTKGETEQTPVDTSTKAYFDNLNERFSNIFKTSFGDSGPRRNRNLGFQ